MLVLIIAELEEAKLECVLAHCWLVQVLMELMMEVHVTIEARDVRAALRMAGQVGAPGI